MRLWHSAKSHHCVISRFGLRLARCARLAVMADRPQKLARLGALRRRLPHMSQQAFYAFLKEAESEPLPEISSYSDVREARDLVVDQMTSFGPLHTKLHLDRTDGATFDLEVQHPLAMLSLCASKSIPFSSFFARVVDRCKGASLGLCLYNDEITPGRSLAHHNIRKSYAIY